MQPPLVIKPLEKSEAESAAKVLCRAFNEPARDMRKQIDESFQHKSHRPVTFVASVNGKIVGVVRYRLYYAMRPGDEPVFGLYSLGVDPAFRKQGIGHTLVKHVEDYIANKTLKPGEQASIVLGDATKKDNPSSTFYEEVGYALQDNAQHPPKDGIPGMIKIIKRETAPQKKTAAPKLSQ